MATIDKVSDAAEPRPAPTETTGWMGGRDPNRCSIRIRTLWFYFERRAEGDCLTCSAWLYTADVRPVAERGPIEDSRRRLLLQAADELTIAAGGLRRIAAKERLSRSAAQPSQESANHAGKILRHAAADAIHA